MLNTVLIAGEDPNARTLFELQGESFNDHRSEIDQRLMD